MCNPLKHYGKIPNFIEKDNILYYKGIKWKDYKNNFKLNNIKTDFDKYNGFWQNTYRLTDINTTGQDAMEKELIEKGIKWFVYIKFYFNKYNLIKPLVAGKSGSKLVNNYGSDVAFDYNDYEGQRAARKFLNEENLKWYNKQIYVIPCKTEKEAYKLESEIQKKYKLFG